MHYGFRSLWILLGVLLSSSIIWAAKLPIEIQGDRVNIDYQSQSLDASGNVKILYKNYVITAPNFQVDLPKTHLVFPDTIHLNQGSLNLEMNNLRYDYSHHTGTASSTCLRTSQVLISGKKVVLYPDRVSISHASFSTCAKTNPPSYHIESSDMTVYPKTGVMVSYWNTVYVYDLPVMIIPSYIYGQNRKGIAGNTSPLPEFGSNQIEGSFIRQGIGYYLNKDAGGTVDLGYTSLLGFEYGANHVQLLDHNSALNVKAHWLDRYGPVGHVGYFWDWSVADMAATQSDEFSTLLHYFSTAEISPEAHFSLLWSYRELINIRRVSYMPMGQLQIQNIEILPKTQLNTIVGTGYAKEEDPLTAGALPIQSAKTTFGTVLTQVHPMTPYWTLSDSLSYYGNWYNTGTWRRLLGTIDNDFILGWFEPGVSYTKSFFNNGQSPFFFDSYNVAQQDELGLKAVFRFSPFSAGVNTHYVLSTGQPRDRDFFVRWQLDCFAINLKWASVQKDFLFDFQLLTQ